MDRRDAHHLLQRTGFGGSSAEIDTVAAMSRSQAVDWAMDFGPNGNPQPPGSLLSFEGRTWEQVRDLRLWWFERMRLSPRPLQEKLALFLHDHFAISARRAYYSLHVWEYLQLLRTRSLGTFWDLARDMSMTPMMVTYLDSYRNKKKSPNENYARELFELHLMGGGYTEQDVLECARAWTGHHLGEDRYFYQFNPRQHDDGNKTIFGITRNWDGPDVIDEIVMRSKRDLCARFMVTNLWSFFAYPRPERSVVDDLARVWIDSGTNLAAVVRAMFNHPQFWSEQARTALLKTPAEWAAGAMRAAGSDVQEARPDWWLEEMGHDIFYAPNPSGWGQNLRFVSATTMLARGDFARHLSWKMVDRDFLREVRDLPVPSAVDLAFGWFGAESVSANTRRHVETYMRRERAWEPWAQHPNLLTMALLSPEVAIA